MTKENKAIRAHYFRTIRWTIAVAGLLIFVALLLNSSFEICDIRTETGNDKTTVTKTCNGPTVTDASVVAVALLFALLLAPDMSEVGVFGVSLKRRVFAAEKKASDSEAKAEKLESQLQIQNLRVDMLAQNVAAATAQATNNVFLYTSEDIKKIDSQLPKKAEAFTRGDVTEPTVADWSSAEDTETAEKEKSDARLVTRIIENWEVLAASLDLPPYRRVPRSDALRIKITANQADQFRFLFEEELQVVRAARNNVAHAKAIPIEDLRSAVDISDQLLTILTKPDQQPDQPPGTGA
ncbi:hypothetical protein [Mycolicibacter heraklionensis]|uniref:hypothetical protein n=1 Tax=Mycolicibacter heraklionensis TaxID=512402 RepID=UPI0007EB2C34|nr:hypothetical protein [Mycolicibacter heraklionensis]OBG37465.1 hypothetical protein A5671_19340 [Mycolicibacter heraklionensis]